MPVFNKMVYNGTEYILGGGGNIGEPLNLTVTSAGLDATITWEDNEIGTIPPTTFQKSELVRKIGSAPTSPSDGTLVVTETVKDTYKVSGYVDQGLTNGETYYYRVFSYSDLGGISYCDAVDVTPSAGGRQPTANTLIYLPLDGDANDQSGNNRDGIIYNNGGSYTWEYVLGASGKQCFSMTATDVDSAYIGGNYSNTALGSGDRTVSIWYKWSGDNDNAGSPRYLGNKNGGTPGGWFGYYWDYGKGGILRYYDDPLTGILSLSSGWHNFIITYNNTNKSRMYIDGVQQTLLTNVNASFDTGNTGFQLGMLRMGGGTHTYYFADFIIEDKARTAQEIQDYFNQTKANYGIS